MSTYNVTRDYKSNFRSKPVAFSKGDKTEVDDELAEWVNRDSPGTLEPVKATKATKATKDGGGG